MRRVLARGEVWASVSVLCYTAISLLVRRATAGGDHFVAVTLRALPAYLVTLIVVLASPRRREQLRPSAEGFIGWKPVAVILFMIIVLGAQGKPALYGTSPPEVVRNLLLAGAVNAVSVLAITQALALSPWAVVMSIGRLNVVLSPLAAVMLLGEHINALMSIGILLVVLGVIAVQLGQALGERRFEDASTGEKKEQKLPRERRPA